MVSAFTLLKRSLLKGIGNPAGTEFNEQLHWIIIHTAQLSLFELRVNTLILYFLVRGRRPVLVETDSLKSQSCISSMRSVQLIRQGEQLNCVPLLDLYSNNDHHLPRHLRLSVSVWFVLFVSSADIKRSAVQIPRNAEQISTCSIVPLFWFWLF